MTVIDTARSIIRRHLITASSPLETITTDEADGPDHVLTTTHGSASRAMEMQDAVTADLRAAGYRPETRFGFYRVGAGGDRTTLTIRLSGLHARPTPTPTTHLTVRMALPAGGEVTVTGERAAVLATVASVHGCAVDVRRNPQSDDGRPWLVVDAAQAEQYPAYLAEVSSEAQNADVIASAPPGVLVIGGKGHGPIPVSEDDLT